MAFLSRSEKKNIDKWIQQQMYINTHKKEASEYVAEHSKLNEEEQQRFVNCYLQENTPESIAYKLNKDIQEMEVLCTRLAIHLATIDILS